MLVYFVFDRYTESNSELIADDKRIATSESIDLLITGDSHARRCLDDAEIEGAINYSYYGENPALTYYKLKHLIEVIGVKPKTVLLQIDITRYCKAYLSYYKNKYYYQEFVDIENLLKKNIISKEDFLQLKLNKLLPHLEMVAAVKRTEYTNSSINRSFDDYDNKQQQKTTNSFVRGKLGITNKASLFYPAALYYLEQTVILCKNHDINILAIKYPVTDIYLEAVSDAASWNVNNPTPQEELIIKYEVPVIDLERSFESQYNLFTDSHHMNSLGKAKCTDLVKELLP